jgi:mRNA interferase MazF
MVNQGDIILLSFDPTIGHEQAKSRPALVLSNDFFNKNTQLAIMCPISHAKPFPMHIELPSGLKTTGYVLCEHIRSMDIDARGYKVLEKVDADFLHKIIKICKMSL